MPLSPVTRSASLALTLCAICTCALPTAHAAASLTTPDCSVSGNSLNCHLLTFLDFLYTTAGFLALLLLVVVLIATRIYSRNKTRIKTPTKGRK